MNERRQIRNCHFCENQKLCAICCLVYSQRKYDCTLAAFRVQTQIYTCILCFLLHFISILLVISIVLFIWFTLWKNTLMPWCCIHVANIILSGCRYSFSERMLFKKNKIRVIARHSILVIRYYDCFVFEDVSDYSEICSLLFVIKSVFSCSGKPNTISIGFSPCSLKSQSTRLKCNTKMPAAVFVTRKKDQYQIKTPFGFHIFIADYELLFDLLCRDLNLTISLSSLFG